MLKQSRSQKGTFKYVCPGGIYTLDTLYMKTSKTFKSGFTKAIPSLSKAALNCKQEYSSSSFWQHSSSCSPEYPSPSLFAGTHCWLMSNFVSTRVPQTILPSFTLVPRSPVCTMHDSTCTQVKECALPFVELQEVSVSSFLQPDKAAWPSGVSATPSSLVSGANVLRHTLPHHPDH